MTVTELYSTVSKITLAAVIAATMALGFSVSPATAADMDKNQKLDAAADGDSAAAKATKEAEAAAEKAKEMTTGSGEKKQ